MFPSIFTTKLATTLVLPVAWAREVFCARGAFGTPLVSGTQAQTAVNVFMRSIGCPNINAVQIAHGGGVVDVTNGIHVILEQTREVGTQISYDVLSGELQFLINQSGCIGAGFGGAVLDDIKIWSVAIVRFQTPVSQGKRDLPSTITGAMPAPTAFGIPQLGRRQAESTSETVFSLVDGVTATFQFIGPSTAAAPVFNGAAALVQDAMLDIGIALADMTGFGRNMGVFAREDITDPDNPGSVELDFEINGVGADITEAILELLTIEAGRRFASGAYHFFRFNVLAAGGFSIAGGQINALPAPVDRERLLPLFGEDGVDQYRGWGLFGRVTEDLELLAQIDKFTGTAGAPQTTAG
ncbi:hypothetical protein LTR09_012120 [Extremus antarcticus]|uniref:Uncharacterized protein n=1 Tax=Extremus antarcticus TaxID=702011 RepID=A0AAJ0DAJ2_9PEZI|nr:hypothetical protein LTR09_012120 [Extremus antarcticus]